MAVLFALMILPLIGLVGLAIDFAVVSHAKTTLDLALDAATMQAVTAAAQATNNDPDASLTPATNAGVLRFNAQAGSLPAMSGIVPSISITRNGTVFTAVGSYTGRYKTYLGSVFGVSNMTVNGTATAVYQTQPYTDVQIMLDSSSSMLVAGTADDVARLTALTTTRSQQQGSMAGNVPADFWGGCAFACHWSSTPGGDDYYQIAHANGVTLRIDQLTNAISSIANSLDSANTASRYRLGVWSFADTVVQSVGLTSDISSVVNIVKSLPLPVWLLDLTTLLKPILGNSLDTDGHNTQLTQAIGTLASLYLTQAGDGSSQMAPKKIIFLMTDGVEDVSNGSGGRNVTAFDPTSCNALKAKGATVAVLHTDFYNPNGMFDEINNITTPAGNDPVGNALKACATSPDLYYEASSQADINTAIQQFLTNVLGIPARLAN